jgi:cytochrome c-type biogenesis protein
VTGFGILLALLAGIVSFASPCCLPMVPIYVSYLVGTGGSTSGVAVMTARRTALRHALVFVAGFTTVFVALWASVGAVGYLLRDHVAPLRIAGGAGLIQISTLYREVRLPIRRVGGRPLNAVPDRPGYGRSLLLGVVFAGGWTPCVGPVLGGIIGLASASRTVVEGTLLLIAYAIGLGVPFVLVALGTSEVSRRLGWLRRHQTGVNLATGAVLVATGFLLITNRLVSLSGALPAFGL